LGLIFIAVGLAPWVAIAAWVSASEIVGDTFPGNLASRYFFRPPDTLRGCLESMARHDAHRRVTLWQVQGSLMMWTWPVILFGGIGWWMGTRALFTSHIAARRIASGCRWASLGSILVGGAIGLKAGYGELLTHLSVEGMHIHTKLLAHTVTEAQLAASRSALILAGIFTSPFALASVLLMVLARRSQPPVSR